MTSKTPTTSDHEELTATSLPIAPRERLLTAEEFQGLAEMPPELEWLGNIGSKRTRAAYERDLGDLKRFLGMARVEEFRQVTRAHVIAWRRVLQQRGLSPATIRRMLSAVSSLFDYLCERNAVADNPVNGVKRPPVENGSEGKTPALGDAQARALLEAPPASTLKGKRDRAILATFLYHGLRREELCGLRVGDIEHRRGVPHFRVRGKGGKLRFLPVHPRALSLIHDYLEACGHTDDGDGALFRSLRMRAGAIAPASLHPDSVYHEVVKRHAKAANIDFPGLCVHGLRATAATNALDNDADIAKVQEWLGHASVATTRLYDRRRSQPEDSPTFRIDYRVVK